MYNLLEYISNYSDTAGNLWFYYNEEAVNFGNDIANTNAFKSFEYKTKLIGSTANGILEDATFAVPLQNQSNFQRSLETQLINCKVELKLRRTKHCVLCVTANDNNNDNPNKTIFTVKGTKLYVHVVSKRKPKIIKTSSQRI